MTVIYAPHQKKRPKKDQKKTKKRPKKDQKKDHTKKAHTKAKAQTAKLKDRAGIVGACMLARSRMFEIQKFNKPVLNKVVKF